MQIDEDKGKEHYEHFWGSVLKTEGVACKDFMLNLKLFVIDP